MSDTKISEAVEAIAARFRSGNTVPVDRASVAREEWEALTSALHHLQGEAVPVGQVVEETNNDSTLCKGVLFATYILSDNYRPGALLYTHPQPAELAEQQGVGNLPRPLEDLRDATQHAINCADGGDDYACGRAMIEAMTTLGIMEKTGRGLWSTNVQVACAVVDALAATGKQQVGEVQGSREQFEAWATEKRLNLARYVDMDDVFCDERTKTAWLAWQAALAATGKQQVDAFPWENLPAYLIDRCEGDTISEEGIQRAVADMAKDARYCQPEQVGEVQGDALPPMPKCHDRQPDDMPGYMESALDWARNPENCDAVEWLMENHAAIRAALAGRQPGEQTFQAGVSEWMGQCFLPSLYSNMTERGDRLLEEVLELLQAHGYDQGRVATLVDYVFGRPVGDPAQEVGGVMVTLAGYCWVAGLDMHAAGDAELRRITQPEVMAKIRRKQEAKNALHFDTPVPGNAAPTAQVIDLGPRPMDTAPRDGTMVRLLVQFTEHATEDTDGPSWTIGANNGEHDGGDLWCFAGWCWTHDHFTEGKGTPVGWLPLIDDQRDAAPGVGA